MKTERLNTSNKKLRNKSKKIEINSIFGKQSNISIKKNWMNKRTGSGSRISHTKTNAWKEKKGFLHLHTPKASPNKGSKI